VIAQACAMAVADAVAYLRNTEIIANAAIGAAMEQLLAGPDPAEPRAAIEAAQASVTAAVASLEAIGAASLQTLRSIPRPAQSIAAD
jgi:predicted component of type VI protein secretion system